MEIDEERQWHLDNVLHILAVELSDMSRGRGQDILFTYLPNQWQSRIELEWSDPFSRLEMIEDTS